MIRATELMTHSVARSRGLRDQPSCPRVCLEKSGVQVGTPHALGHTVPRIPEPRAQHLL